MAEGPVRFVRLTSDPPVGYWEFSMKIATVRSVCECETRLYADVDEHLSAIRGWARDGRGRQSIAPATALRAGGGRFDVGWMCPSCTRNVLRSFDSTAIAFREDKIAG
jgi:hypothetical protein